MAKRKHKHKHKHDKHKVKRRTTEYPGLRQFVMHRLKVLMIEELESRKELEGTDTDDQYNKAVDKEIRDIRKAKTLHQVLCDIENQAYDDRDVGLLITYLLQVFIPDLSQGEVLGTETVDE